MSSAENHDNHGTPTTKATLNGLAVVGFFGLVIAGILLAIYAARFVPDTLARLSAAVYLSSDGAQNATTTPEAPEPERPVVTPEPETPAVATSTPPTPVTGGPLIVTRPTTQVVQNRPSYYGYADLALVGVRAGYFSGSTFIEDDQISTSRDMGIKFMVRNAGTNIASGWLVRVRVEGQRDAIAQGGVLYPNGYQNFTLRITDSDTGTITTRIEVDYQNAIPETNESNNNSAIDVDVGRSSSSSSRDVSCNLDASDTRVDEGDRVTLEWDTDGNPNYASINQGIGRVDEDGGTERVTIDDDTTFRMTVRNSRGDEDTCSVTVRID